MHAVAGGIALMIGAAQFNRRILRAFPIVHRWAGRTSVICIWITSIGGLWSAVFFDVPVGGRAALIALAVHWFVATTVAYRLARRRRIGEHRRWMIRSFALSLFFVTFPLWTSAFASSPLPENVGYPSAVLAAWSVNVALGEVWIRRHPTVSGRRSRPPADEIEPPAPGLDSTTPASLGVG